MATHDGSGTLSLAFTFQGAGTEVLRVSGSVPLVLLLGGTIRRSPRVASATPLSSTRVRVTFDGQMVSDSQLMTPSNYVFTTLAPGAVAVSVRGVTPQPGVTYPTYVDIDLTEMTQGGSYRVTVNTGPGSPVDRYGFTVNAVGKSADFSGVGTAPTVVSVAAVGTNRVDVKFSEPMLDDGGDIRDPGRYSFDGGLTVLSVLDVVGDTVKLVTSDQTPGQLYNLTIS
jgi:hypothetical protein